ncbi:MULTISPECIES: DUF948 domain-containing protein [Bacillaceae]|jgi:uncharacterized protein YoxC|uniref:DUF948 domain-containing protein n=1 Tax=Ectobacillus funiculus TaxID=137993 RepID=A0ABV5WI48_9BACI|nr:DUF948 domain-containing protein [Ectobacillus funiculus]
MEIILYVSALIAAIAFAVLAAYLGNTLVAMRKTLLSLARTTAALEKQLQGVTYETEQLLHKTNALAEDIQQKSQSLNKVVKSVEGIGTTIDSINGKLAQATNSVTHQVEQNADKVAQVMQWSTAAIEVYGRLRKRKLEKDEQRERKQERPPVRVRGE